MKSGQHQWRGAEEEKGLGGGSGGEKRGGDLAQRGGESIEGGGGVPVIFSPEAHALPAPP